MITDGGHRRCDCGAFPEQIGTMHTREVFIRCPNCGARSVSKPSPFRAWAAWDSKQLLLDDENVTLWEVLGE